MTSSSNTIYVTDGLLHEWRNGRLDYCSQAEPWSDEEDRPLPWGNCLHYDDPDGGPAIVCMDRPGFGRTTT